MNVGMCILKTRRSRGRNYFGTVKAADVVIVTGGDQLRLTSIRGLFTIFLLDKYHNEELCTLNFCWSRGSI
jgi:cyanophycinase